MPDTLLCFCDRLAAPGHLIDLNPAYGGSQLMRASPLVSAFLWLCVLLAGCAGEQNKAEPRGYLATQIEDDGSKIFQYTLVSDISEPNERGRNLGMGGHLSGGSNRGMSGGLSIGSRGRSGGGSRNGRQTDVGAKLQTMAQEELVKTGYCRAGFTEIERATRPPQIYIRGKCKDSASAKDRKRFLNESD